MAFKFDYEQSTLKSGMDNIGPKVVDAAMMYATTKATELESKMKTNRPWTDRTGMAKATLNAKVSQPDKNKVRITLAHGVEYGIDLELARERKYAIVYPTLVQEGPHVAAGLKDLMLKIKL